MTLKQHMEEIKKREQPEWIAKQLLTTGYCLKHKRIHSDGLCLECENDTFEKEINKNIQ